MDQPSSNDGRPTRAVISLEAIRNNVRLVREKCSGSKAEVMAVVKANGYGHGMEQVAKASLEAGATSIGVATSDEALTLRSLPHFEDTMILVMAPVLPNEVGPLIEKNLSFSVGSTELLKESVSIATRLKKPARIHIQTDTGIGRDGFYYNDPALEDIGSVKDHIEGLFTHFAVSDETDEESIEFTNLQCERFERVYASFKSQGCHPIRHAANSGAVLRHPRAHYDIVRPGIMIYGLEPNDHPELEPRLQQAMTLISSLSAIREMKKGDTVSYGRTWELPDDRRIGIIPIGYGDGYFRYLSNQGHVLVHGKEAPIRGRVCMDQIMVDLNGIPEAKVGDEVVLWGKQENNSIEIEDIARMLGTISYEITCSLTPRVPRTWLNE